MCYDKTASKLFHPIEGNSKPSARQQLAGHGMEELTFRPQMLVTSECGGGNWTSGTSAASPLQVPAGPVDYPGTNKLYRKAAPFEFSTYAFKDKSRYPKYAEKDYPRDNHVLVNGVVYGPTDTHKAKDSMHGVPVCSMWERTAEVKVKTGRSGPTFSAKENKFDYKLECEPRDICRDWVIAHACGFDHENVVLLKRVGRTGQCQEVETSLLSGAHCPSGTYHNSVAWGSGGFRFCDCDGPAECKVG